MVEAPEAVGDVTLDEPGRPFPGVDHLAERGVTSPAGTETVGSVGERRLVVRLQQQPDHFTDEFIRPGRQTQGSCLRRILLGDIDTPCRLESVALVLSVISNADDWGG